MLYWVGQHETSPTSQTHQTLVTWTADRIEKFERVCSGLAVINCILEDVLQDVCVLKRKRSSGAEGARKWVTGVTDENNAAVGSDSVEQTWAAEDGKLEPLVGCVDDRPDGVAVSLTSAEQSMSKPTS